MTAIYNSHESDGIDFLCTVAFDTLSGATTLLGATFAVDAISPSGARFAGATAYVGPNQFRCTFAGWAMSADTYSVQSRARPAGYAEETVADTTWIVKVSAGVKP